jgi:hypothetical protein
VSVALELARDAYRLAGQARDEGEMAQAQVVATIALAVATVQAAGHQTPHYEWFQEPPDA